ncbi:MAG: glutamyl-tRNA synthetase [Candidatus Parcubacteria bacterium]|jgi:glutamyl-tRNA synthetase|nr:glutamyl-tRNA synthetase [Candidatus Parcubacteria bacterium]
MSLLANVVTRFAPSPTGLLHAGNYRTALFSYVYAAQNKGKFILRIEDSDRARSKKEYEDNIVESLKWLGLPYDEFYRQSDRLGIYRSYLAKLIESGQAFVSKETPVESGGRTEVIRFKNPNAKIRFADLVRGDIEFDTTELGDFVVARSLDEPLFHLAVVVDDHEMEVTHVIRGEDHISNTARQILIARALGFDLPAYAHVPLLLSPGRGKLSKRGGAPSITAYRDRGYLAEALVNYMILLGWNPGDEQEILSREEIVAKFSLGKIQKGGAIFDEEKLKWFNRQYLRRLSDGDFALHASPFVPEWLGTGSPAFKRLLPLLKEKISTFGEIAEVFDKNGELDFVRGLLPYAADLLLWKKKPEREGARAHLAEARKLLAAVSADHFTAERIKDTLWPYAEEHGKGDVLWPLRVALTGKEKSPDPFTAAALVGREEALKRIDHAIKYLA